MGTPRRKTGKCPECSGIFSLRKSGVLRVHGYRTYPRGGVECTGSGRNAESPTTYTCGFCLAEIHHPHSVVIE
jgi:hypothetical protein